MIVEKNMPLSRPRTGRARYPHSGMEVVDGFSVPTDKDRQRAKATLWHYTRTGIGKGRRFASRTINEGCRMASRPAEVFAAAQLEGAAPGKRKVQA